MIDEARGRLGPGQGWSVQTGGFRQARERAANLVCLILVGAIATMALPLIAGGLLPIG